MGDMAEVFREMRKDDQERRHRLAAEACGYLQTHGVPFRWDAGNLTIVVNTQRGRVQYWPSRRKWYSASLAQRGQGNPADFVQWVREKL